MIKVFEITYALNLTVDMLRSLHDLREIFLTPFLRKKK